jgi:hypothetical protein
MIVQNSFLQTGNTKDRLLFHPQQRYIQVQVLVAEISYTTSKFTKRGEILHGLF